MDVDEFQSQIYTGNNKYPRLSSTTNNGTKIGPHYPPEDEDDDAHTLASNAAAAESAEPQSLADSMFRGWHNSSRIFRVSRASGGKDRHSKVFTSKGLRDRRVRLSVSTAIQFYDLQDRLGYDQPSKAVEWLIKAAADSIAELPSLRSPFPETPRQVVDSELGFDSAEADAQQQKRNLSISKSASSTSETSKGSGLSLTRTDVRVNQRVKARERARERAKEKECESEQAVINVVRSQTANPISSHPNTTTSSFTELLTGGNQGALSPNSAPMMDYFTNAGLISGHHATASQPTLTSHHQHHQAAACLFLGQTQMGNSMSIPTSCHLSSREHHRQHYAQHLSFGQENLIPVRNEYDLNFSISSSPSSMAGYNNNRGTLQSNSPSAASSMLHHNFQRYAASMEGSNVPAFFVTAQPSSSNQNQHHFSTGFDGGLHLCYGDEGRHADFKDKGKK